MAVRESQRLFPFLYVDDVAAYLEFLARAWEALGGPDLLLGFDCDPKVRNVVGLYGANPEGLFKPGIA